MVETFGRSELPLEPRWGAHSAPPDPLAGGEEACCPSQETHPAVGPSVLAPMKNPAHVLSTTGRVCSPHISAAQRLSVRVQELLVACESRTEEELLQLQNTQCKGPANQAA